MHSIWLAHYTVKVPDESIKILFKREFKDLESIQIASRSSNVTITAYVNANLVSDSRHESN